MLNQRSELGFVQPRESHQTGLQLLQLCLRMRVEIDATNTLLGTRALQPTEEDLGGTRIGDCALAQTTLDLRIRRGAYGYGGLRNKCESMKYVCASTRCRRVCIGPRRRVPGTGSSAIARLSAISKDAAMSWSRRRVFAADD